MSCWRPMPPGGNSQSCRCLKGSWPCSTSPPIPVWLLMLPRLWPGTSKVLADWWFLDFRLGSSLTKNLVAHTWPLGGSVSMQERKWGSGSQALLTPLYRTPDFVTHPYGRAALSKNTANAALHVRWLHLEFLLQPLRRLYSRLTFHGLAWGA